MNWWKSLKSTLRRNEPLKKHTTWRIGGRVRFFVEPYDAADLKLLINALKRYKITPLVMGAGSNILACDKGINSAVIRLSAKNFCALKVTGTSLIAGAGCPLSRIVAKAAEKGLSGLEFLAGIPGTVGGALAMNAGAWGRDVSGVVRSATLMDYRGTVKTLEKKDILFGYRMSSLSRYIILGARFSLTQGNRDEIRSKISAYLSRRKETQDTRYPCAGSVFKNPAGFSAGQLIDACGLKGARRGGAEISRRHANFIVNKRGAKASDVLKLMALAKREVQKKFNLELEPEIKIWK